jgi:tetrameric-type glycyl-tRNA synthetase beta subunit
LHPKAATVRSSQDYFAVVRHGQVILEPSERQQRIATGSEALAAEVRAFPQLDFRLLEETVMTTEHPVVLRGEFSPEFLSLPQEVLVTVMEHHQKYFPLVDASRRLQPYFIAVRDGGRQHLATVREGHEWVLRARLADARFFFDEDRRRRLEEYVPALEGLVVQAQLGTMAEKTRRLGHLVNYIVDTLGLDHAARAHLQRAAHLAKADLVTHLVGEFPELQGIIGGIYAALDGEPVEVATAIREHYHPAGAGDPPPASIPGALLAMIDRVDTLVGALAAGLDPTGSQDPYGLRRAAQGIVEIMLAHRLSLLLRPLVRASAAQYAKAGEVPVEHIVNFIQQRLRAQLVEQGLRYDLVDAALAVSGDVLVEGANRAAALQAFAARPEFVRLYVAYDRASRILGREVEGIPDPDLFEVEAERALYRAATLVRELVDAAIEEGDYAQALEALVPLAEPVDKLFDDVLIMATDPRVQANRLALLGQVVTIFRAVADFSKVVMTDEAGREPAKASEPRRVRST